MQVNFVNTVFCRWYKGWSFTALVIDWELQGIYKRGWNANAVLNDRYVLWREVHRMIVCDCRTEQSSIGNRTFATILHKDYLNDLYFALLVG